MSFELSVGDGKSTPQSQKLFKMINSFRNSVPQLLRFTTTLPLRIVPDRARDFVPGQTYGRGQSTFVV